MMQETFDPRVAYGLRFADDKLARCVRETAKMRVDSIDELRCFQCGIKELEGIEQWYQQFGDSLPAELSAELQRLKERFAA